MNNNLRSQIIHAIRNFDIDNLDMLLDDKSPYMDVTKSLFLQTLAKKFERAKESGCNSFDDVFFGICGSCNKGCEGMTFLSLTGYYLDLFIESKNDQTVDDIYVCNKLTNFTDLDKEFSLGFSFCKDQEVNFKPSTEYTLIERQFNLLVSDLKEFKNKIRLDDLIVWYDSFYYLKTFTKQLRPFEYFDYKLYSKVFSLIKRINNLLDIKSKSEFATDALISYHLSTSEREKLIWFFQNKQNHYGTSYFEFPKNWKINSCVIYKEENIELTIDISDYEYVMDYFLKIDNLYDELMEKYKPLPEHYEQSLTRSVEYSLESYLRLHNKYADIVEKYGGR